MLEVKINAVTLPQNYRRTLVPEEGQLVAYLNPAVNMPFRKSTLEQLTPTPRQSDPSKFQYNRRYNLPVWNQLLVSVLKETMPDFVCTSPDSQEFYSLARNNLNSDCTFDGNDYRTNLSDQMDYGHNNESSNNKGSKMPLAWCRIKASSPEDFYPIINEGILKCPTIDRIFFQAYVAVSPYIRKSEKSEEIFNLETSTYITRALLSQKDIVLKSDDKRLRKGVLFLTPLVYVQVFNPTVKRMQKAISESEKVEKFFSSNSKQLFEIAEHVQKAKIANSCIWTINSAHEKLTEEYDKLRKQSKLKIPKAPNSNLSVNYLETEIKNALGQANALLSPLRSSFNSNLFEYAMQDEFKDHSSQTRSFHFHFS